MSSETAIEMFVGGLVLDPSTQAPIVVLKDETGQYTLPIWIGVAEATSIASAIKQVHMARPLTHDLMFDAFSELGVKVERIVITDLRESTYYAELVIAHGDKVMILDARPSDAIALALRAAAPIFVSEQVLSFAASSLTGQQDAPADQESSPPAAQEEAEPEFEGSSDQGSPAGDVSVEDVAGSDFRSIDKDKWNEILNSLDPDDFKYKV